MSWVPGEKMGLKWSRDSDTCLTIIGRTLLDYLKSNFQRKDCWKNVISNYVTTVKAFKIGVEFYRASNLCFEFKK